MRSYRRLFTVTAASATTFGTATMAATAPELPTISAAGLHRPLEPPNLGPKPAVLLSVQVAFRHGARTPISDAGCRDGLCDWRQDETSKSDAALASTASVLLFRPGSGDPLDPSVLFAGDSSSLLQGGARSGDLTAVGVQQACDLGAELRARYVDTSTVRSSDVRSRYLLPAGWDRSRRLVKARSTCVERTVYTAAGVLGGLFPELR